jgi:hypothetical protein
MALPPLLKENEVKLYLKRLVELAGAGFVAGAGEHVIRNGFELSAASVQGLVVAAALAAYGVVVKKLGEDNRPTAL